MTAVGTLQMLPTGCPNPSKEKARRCIQRRANSRCARLEGLTQQREDVLLALVGLSEHSGRSLTEDLRLCEAMLFSLAS